jgi:hypothetical protein
MYLANRLAPKADEQQRQTGYRQQNRNDKL